MTPHVAVWLRLLPALAAAGATSASGCPAGANCYEGPSSGGAWFAGPWSLARTPSYPDTVVVANVAEIAVGDRGAEGAASSIVVDNAIIDLEGEELQVGPRWCYAATERQLAAPTASASAVCEPLQPCADGEYVHAEHTATAHAECRPWGCDKGDGTGTNCASCVDQADRQSATDCATCHADHRGPYVLSDKRCYPPPPKLVFRADNRVDNCTLSMTAHGQLELQHADLFVGGRMVSAALDDNTLLQQGLQQDVRVANASLLSHIVSTTARRDEQEILHNATAQEILNDLADLETLLFDAFNASLRDDMVLVLSNITGNAQEISDNERALDALSDAHDEHSLVHDRLHQHIASNASALRAELLAALDIVDTTQARHDRAQDIAVQLNSGNVTQVETRIDQLNATDTAHEREHAELRANLQSNMTAVSSEASHNLTVSNATRVDVDVVHDALITNNTHGTIDADQHLATKAGQAP